MAANVGSLGRKDTGVVARRTPGQPFTNDDVIRHPSSPSTIQLTGVYHNLLRQWAEVG